MIEVFQLESAVCCNLNCKFCYRHTNLEEIENTFISLDETRNLFTRNTQCQNISIVNKGEFFVHADWKNIFSYVAEEVSESEFCEAIILITNTTLMTEEKTDYIFETLEKFNFNLRISFSVNAFNPETFLKITGKNLLEKINQNINYFYNKLSKSSACDRVWTNIQFLVTEDNFCEALDFIQYWKTFLDKQNLDYDICEDNFNSKKKHIITLKRMYAGVKGGGECFEKAASEAEIKFNFKRGPQIEYGNDYFRKKACMFVFKHPVISENKKTICCRDVFFEHSYPVKGDFSEQFELYTRTSHILGRFENLSLCLKCTEYVEVDFDTIKEFSDKTALYNLIDIYNKRKKHGIPFDFYKIDFEKKDSQFIKEFLKNNEFTCFKTSTLIKNDIIPVTLEKDSCAYWTSILKVKQGRIYAGCHKIDIEIDDFNSYKENLKNDNYKEIPVECIICSVKKSVNSIQDRFRTFGKNSFHSFIENYHEKNKIFRRFLHY